MFIPRLNDSGMLNNKYWYSDNPFYLSGFGLPNCTCYAWGRFWEETPDNKPVHVPLGDATTWWEQAVNEGYFETGQEPKLGAIACFKNGINGHVAIVEKIDNKGNITTSNSAWGGEYFFTKTLLKNNNYYDVSADLLFQGFIYNSYLEPIPPIPTDNNNKKFPWVLYANKIRSRINS